MTEPLGNWAGNHAYAAARIHRPESLAALREIVRRSTRIRALGTRHSFNDIADCGGDLVSLEHFTALLALEPERRRATLDPGMRYGELGAALCNAGWALANLASLPHISVGGAIMTGTHGSGLSLGNLATSVAAIELLTAGGDLRPFSRENDPDIFHALPVSLGALGIATRITLEIQPTFEICQRVFEDLPLTALLAHHEEIFASAYSVSLFTDWRSDRINQVWLKERLDASGPSPPASDFFGAAPATQKLHPLAGISPVHCTEQLGLPGPWHQRLPHFRLDFTPSGGEELQSEYFVPFESLPAALEALRPLAPQIAATLLISELRAIAADALWLSPCFGRRSAAIHFTWKPDWPGVRAVLPKIEAALSPFSPRPHWGKLFTLSSERIRRRYPRLHEFQQLMKQLDPTGKFRNAYMERNLSNGTLAAPR